MADKKNPPKLTLIDTELAEKDFEFISEDMGPECRDCNLFKICSNLEKGMRYKVVSIRDKTHSCALTESTVNVVEVEEVKDLEGAVKKELTKGSAVEENWRKNCEVLGCEYRILCFPEGFISGKTYKIQSVSDNFKCPDTGTVLTKVVLKEDDE